MIYKVRSKTGVCKQTERRELLALEVDAGFVDTAKVIGKRSDESLNRFQRIQVKRKANRLRNALDFRRHNKASEKVSQYARIQFEMRLTISKPVKRLVKTFACSNCSQVVSRRLKTAIYRQIRQNVAQVLKGKKPKRMPVSNCCKKPIEKVAFLKPIN